ncbi:hypothetical protein [Bdellovibrio sp. HCB337]|uniref:hypothetical protein n=1 Tax=Bdellovibrio sp. HCB337 TaxID=3394358 RepID=UPI0039A770C0
MSKNQKLLIVLVILGAALWAALRFSSQNNENKTSAESEAPADMPLPAHSGPSTLPTVPHPASASNNGAQLPLLGPHLRKIGECLQIKNVLDETAPLSFDALHDSVKNELGDLVSKEFDWKNVHTTLPNGEKRRIRMEVEAKTEETSGIRIKYYGVDAEDLPVPLPLPEDQSWNPSEAFVASLEGEGQTTLREEAHRGLYTQGSELYYVERNGALSELEILHHGKSVKCQDMQSAQGHCTCF